MTLPLRCPPIPTQYPHLGASRSLTTSPSDLPWPIGLKTQSMQRRSECIKSVDFFHFFPSKFFSFGRRQIFDASVLMPCILFCGENQLGVTRPRPVPSFSICRTYNSLKSATNAICFFSDTATSRFGVLVPLPTFPSCSRTRTPSTKS